MHVHTDFSIGLIILQETVQTKQLPADEEKGVAVDNNADHYLLLTVSFTDG